ncbi:MAG: Gfo/Idh/MocA family protein [Dehalococcoidia bacterium]
MTIGWAIIGTGRHPNVHIAPAIHRSQEGRLVGVVSRDKGRALEAARRLGAEKGYGGLDEMLEDREVDAVFISSPNSLHAEQTLKAARGGKHVLCEKPMALTVADAQAMVDACRANGVKLGVGFHLRHHPGHQLARRLVAEGEVGPVTMALGQWSIDGRGLVRGGWWAEPEMAGAGIIMGTGTHVIDLLRFVLQREVVEVSAFSDGQRSDRALDSNMLALLRFEGGSQGVLICSRNFACPRNDLLVYGADGRLTGVDTVGEAMRGWLELANRTGSARWEFAAQEPEVELYKGQVDAFNRCIVDGAIPSASGEDGLAVVRITEAILASARDGRAISVGR